MMFSAVEVLPLSAHEAVTAATAENTTESTDDISEILADAYLDALLDYLADAGNTDDNNKTGKKKKDKYALSAEDRVLLDTKVAEWKDWKNLKDYNEYEDKEAEKDAEKITKLVNGTSDAIKKAGELIKGKAWIQDGVTASEVLDDILGLASMICKCAPGAGPAISAAIDTLVAIQSFVGSFGDQPEAPMSDLERIQGMLEEQTKELLEAQNKTNQKIDGISREISQQTDTLLQAISNQSEVAGAKEYVQNFLSRGEGNFSYYRYRNYLFGDSSTSAGVTALQAYNSLRLESEKPLKPELYEFYTEKLYDALTGGDSLETLLTFSEYLTGGEDNNSILTPVAQCYYMVISSEQGRAKLPAGTMPEEAAIQFTLDLYNTIRMAGETIKEIHKGWRGEMALTGADEYTTASGITRKKAQMDSIDEKIDAQMAVWRQSMARDLAFILQCADGYHLRTAAGAMFEVIDRGGTAFSVRPGDTVYLRGLGEAFSDNEDAYAFSLNTQQFTYRFTDLSLADTKQGFFTIPENTEGASFTVALMYPGKNGELEEVYQIKFHVSTDTDAFYGGDGSEEHPYLVGNAEQFLRIRDGLDQHYRLIGDIDFASIKEAIAPFGVARNEDGSLYWEEFQGTLDGDGYTLRNLTVSDIGSEYAGLFAVLGEDGCLKNLTLENIKVTASRSERELHAGILVGWNKGQIVRIVLSESEVTAKIDNGDEDKTVNLYAGGVAGWNSATISIAVVENCTVSAVAKHNMHGSANAGANRNCVYAGGICGYNGDENTGATLCGLLVRGGDTKIEAVANTESGYYKTGWFGVKEVGVHPQVRSYAGGITARTQKAYQLKNVLVTEEVGLGATADVSGEKPGEDSLVRRTYKLYNYPDAFDIGDFPEYKARYEELKAKVDWLGTLIGTKEEREEWNNFHNIVVTASGEDEIVDALFKRATAEVSYAYNKVEGYRHTYPYGSTIFETEGLTLTVNGKIYDNANEDKTDDYTIYGVYGFNTLEPETHPTVNLLFGIPDSKDPDIEHPYVAKITIDVGPNDYTAAKPEQDTFEKGTMTAEGMWFILTKEDGEFNKVQLTSENKPKITGDTHAYGTQEFKITFTMNGKIYEFPFTATIVCTHDYGDWTTIKESTCDVKEGGYATRECKKCHEIETELLPMLSHIASAGPVNVTDPSCAVDGYTGDIICTVCGHVLETGATIPMLGHDYGMQQGNENKHVCNRDGCTDPVEPHTYLVSESVNADGELVYTYTCKGCGYVKQVTDENGYDEKLPIVMVSDGYVTPSGSRFVTIFVQLINNPGITGAAFGIRYDPRLKLVGDPVAGKLLAKNPLQAGNGKVTCGYNIASVGLNDDLEKKNGNLLVLTFEVPRGAEIGAEYEINVTYLDGNGGFAKGVKAKKICYPTRSGTIRVVEHLPGDVNGDGKVNLLDALLIARYVVADPAGKEAMEKAGFLPVYADVDLDGSVTVDDISLVLNSLVGGAGEGLRSRDYRIILNASGAEGDLSQEDKEALSPKNVTWASGTKYENLGLPSPVRKGYKFLGWSWQMAPDKDGKLVLLNPENAVVYQDNVRKQILYAQWERNEITVDGNGATSGTTEKLIYGKDYSTVKDNYQRDYGIKYIPVYQMGEGNFKAEKDEKNFKAGRLHYTCAGYLTSDGTLYTTWDALLKALEEENIGYMTVYVQWKPVLQIQTSSEDSYEDWHQTTTPWGNKDGYTENTRLFGKYTVSMNDVVSLYNEVSECDDILKKGKCDRDGNEAYVLYVRFQPITYNKVILAYTNTNGESATKTIEAPKGTPYSVENPLDLSSQYTELKVELGYVLSGWQLQNGETPWSIKDKFEYHADVLDGCITLQAIYTEIEYELQYDINFIFDEKWKGWYNDNGNVESNIKNKIKKINESIKGLKKTLKDDFVISSDEYVLPGYIFLGWATEKGGKVKECQVGATVKMSDIVNNNNAEITLYAVWKVDMYNIGQYVNEDSKVSHIFVQDSMDPINGGKQYYLYTYSQLYGKTSGVWAVNNDNLPTNVIIDLSQAPGAETGTYTTVDMGGAVLKIGKNVKTVYFVGQWLDNATEVSKRQMYTNFSVELRDREDKLTLTFRKFNYKSNNRAGALRYIDDEDGKVADLDIILQGERLLNSIRSSAPGGHAVNLPNTNITFTGGSIMNIQACAGAAATVATEAGGNGGIALKAAGLTISLDSASGELKLYGGNGGSGLDGQKSGVSGSDGGDGGLALDLGETGICEVTGAKIFRLTGGNGGNGGRGADGSNSDNGGNGGNGGKSAVMHLGSLTNVKAANGSTGTIEIICGEGGLGGNGGNSSKVGGNGGFDGASASYSAYNKITGVTLKPAKRGYNGVGIAGRGSEDAVNAFGLASRTTVLYYNKHTYLLILGKVTWKEAQAYAEQMGGYLAVIEDATENDMLYRLVKNTTQKGVWIGATDEEVEKSWKWVNGKEFSYANWKDNEPNNNDGLEHYAGLCPADGGKWNDFELESDGVQSFLVEIDSYIDTGRNVSRTYVDENQKTHTYRLVFGISTWWNAYYCAKEMGGHLATFETEAEWEAVREFIPKYTSSVVWLGASDVNLDGKREDADGKTIGWKWVTGGTVVGETELSEADYWAEGEPSGTYGGNAEDYMGCYGTGDCKWNDFGNSTDQQGAFLIEIE